eukprot:6198023-Pleurochrysis_carterae.AAC.7
MQQFKAAAVVATDTARAVASSRAPMACHKTPYLASAALSAHRDSTTVCHMELTLLTRLVCLRKLRYVILFVRACSRVSGKLCERASRGARLLASTHGHPRSSLERMDQYD